MGTTIFRLVILVVIVTLGWSLSVTCMDGRVADQVTVSAPAESDCPPSTGLMDCCTTTQPFVAVKKVTLPRLEVAAPNMAASEPITVENLFLHLPTGVLLEPAPPPGDKHPTPLTVSILRI